MSIATKIETVSIWTDELTSLLALYREFTEEEHRHLDPADPHTVAVLISREHIGFALLHAIEDKAHQIQELAETAASTAYEQAHQHRSG